MVTYNTAPIALSIKQPFAWLIASGYKYIENRNWYTRYRGSFFIHAGKQIDKEGLEWVKEMIRAGKIPSIALPDAFDTGGFVGRGKVIDCIESSDSPWFVGSYGFVISDTYPIKLVPYPGRLSFFNIPLALAKEMNQ